MPNNLYNPVKTLVMVPLNQNKIDYLRFIIILHHYPSESRRIFVDMLLKDNFLVYPSLEAAANSFLKLYEYGKKATELSKNFS